MKHKETVDKGTRTYRAAAARHQSRLSERNEGIRQH